MRHAFIMEINMEGTWVPTMVSIETTARACEAIHESARVRRLKTIAQWRVAITALRNLACPNAERREDDTLVIQFDDGRVTVVGLQSDNPRMEYPE